MDDGELGAGPRTDAWPPRLLVVSRSAHKLAEIRRIFEREETRYGRTGAELLSLEEAGIAEGPAEERIESFDTFAENALAKACHFFTLAGMPTLADDSGLVVDALGGAPGVRSRRFAPDPSGESTEGRGSRRDEANNRHLLNRLAGIPDEERTARYVCVLALVGWGGMPVLAKGSVEGRILRAPKGRGGFGYDPYFVGLGGVESFAELAPSEKDAASHRGRALHELWHRLSSTGRHTG